MSSAKMIDHSGLPMPLWLQGVVEALQLLFIASLLVVAPIAAVHFTGGFGAQTLEAGAALAGQAWLLTQGVPLAIVPGGGTGEGPVAVAALSLVPLGAIAVPFLLLAWRSGRRMARACYTDQLWPVLLEVVLLVGATNVVVALVSTTAYVQPNLVAAVLIPLLPLIAGLVIGARREAGSWSRLIGLDAVAWLQARTGQVSRWTGSYLWTVLCAATVTVLVLFAAAALTLALNLLVHWADIVTVYEELQAGPVGAAAVTLAQIAYLPNIVVWTMSWLAGPGFALGLSSTVSPLSSAVAPVPAIPLLAAVPLGQNSLETVALLIPVLAGGLGGWWFFRAGEDHLGDWFAIRIRISWLASLLSSLALGAITGLVVGVLGAAAGWVSSGSGGFIRFSQLGPSPWLMGIWLALEVGVGVPVGKMLAPAIERIRERHQQETSFDPFA